MSQMTVEEALAPFLAPVRDLSQNFDINLGQLLQEYLDKIGSSNIEVSDAVNFTEAAIVLQQSANIYGKKVDYLWQVLMQVLDSFQRKKKQEEEAAAAQKKGKPEKTNLAYISPDFCELDDDEALFDDSVQINISPDYVPNPIKLLPKYNPQLEMKLAAEKKLTLCGLLNNVIGNKYDFRVNKYLSTDGLLIDEPELNIVGSASATNCDLITNVGNTQFPSSPDIGGRSYVEENVQECFDENISEACNINVENDTISNTNSPKEKAVEIRERRSACRRKPDKIITLDSDPWKAWPVDKQVPNKKFVKAVTYKIPPDLLNLSAEQNKKKVFDKNVHNLENYKYPCIFQFFSEIASRKVEKKTGHLADAEFYLCLKNDTPRGVATSEEVKEMVNELAKEFGVAVEDWEDDILDNDHDFAADIVDDDQDFEGDVGDNHEDCFTEPPEGVDVDNPPLPSLPTNVKFPNGEILPEAYLNHLQLESNFANTSTYEEYSHEAFSVAALQVKPIPGLAAKVNEWHDSIRPKLQAANERGSFDIHAYGTKIISKLQTTSSKLLPFKDVTSFEKTEDVPRFFLAALMLANSRNIEISKSDNTTLAMDCMNLSLLSLTRHHEVFDECADPK